MATKFKSIMHIGTCVITFRLYAVDSLKTKRSQLKPLLTRLPQQFNVAVAEIDGHDSYSSAVICLVTVGNDAAQVHRRLEKSVSWIESSRPDLKLETYSIEML